MKPTKLFIALAVTFAHTVAYGQETTSLNAIVIKGSAEETENSVNVTESDLLRTNPTDLQDVFLSEPTITVSSSVPVSQKLFVNGVEETNLAVTIDGSRQNNKIFHHNATTIIDPALLKTVSIDPGVASADAGPGALAGSVEYETKDVADLLEAGKTFGGFVVGEYDSNGGVITPSLSLYSQQNGFEFLGFAKVADGDEKTDGNGNEITGSSSALESFLGKIAYESQAGDRFEASYERVQDDAQRPYRADIGLINGGRPVALTRRYALDRENVVFSYTDENATGSWNPTIQLALSSTTLELEEPDDYNSGETESVNGKVENEFALNNGSITTGVDFYSEQASFFYGYDSSTGEESASNIGLYVQSRLNVTDALSVSTGVRGDYHSFEGLNDFEESNSGLSFNGSFEYKLTKNLTASTGYSSVFAGIPLAENFIMNNAWVYDETALNAVESENAFAALRADFEGFYVDGKVFQTEIEGARIAQYADGNLTSDMQSQGYEIGTGVAWKGGFARISYADIDTEVNGYPSDTFSGRYLTAPIGRLVTLESSHAFGDTGFIAGADARIGFEEQGYYLDTEGDTIDGFEVVNAFVEYSPSETGSFIVRLEANNIFDEAYAERGTYGQEFEEVDSLLEPGRAFKLSITKHF